MKKKIDLPHQLITAITNRDCVFFIGAGLSIDAGLPTGKQIAEELLTLLKGNRHTGPPPPLCDVAQTFEDSMKRPELANAIRGIIAKAMKKANMRPFELLTKVRPPPIDIVTTNWDKLIEDAFGRYELVVIENDKSLAQHLSGKTNLIKIHGDLDNLIDATMTKDDYIAFNDKHKGFRDEISTLFRTKTILFIGYSTEDWDFLEMYLNIQNELRASLNPRYCVTVDTSHQNEDRFRRLNIEHIKVTATEFLESLVANLVGEEGEGGRLLEEHMKFPSPMLPAVMEKNPFVVFRAEDMTDELWERELFREPKMYNIFGNIIAPGNTIIEGHRGSGKSMILLYLSYRVQRLLQRTPGFVGLYVKLDLPLFATTRRRREERDEWVDYFLGYFNLVVSEELVRLLDLSVSNTWVSITDIRSLLEKLRGVIPFLSDMETDSLRDLADLIHKARSALGVPPPRTPVKVPGDLTKSIIDTVRRFVPEWDKKPFYVLLDEYERLDENQQKVVNLLLASRGPTELEKIYFKIAVKSFELTLADIDENQLEPGHDFTQVQLDRFDLDRERTGKQYQNFIEELANHRLNEIWSYQTSIRELLPEKGEGFEKRDYSGFENIVTLSSFLPRDFLELCKDMVFYSYPTLLEEPKKSKMDPISPSLQNTVIKIHAENLFENISRTTGESEKNRRKTRSENARKLIESLGELFKGILHGSRTETRTVSEFQIRNVSELNEAARDALNDCTRVRALRVPLTQRSPQVRQDIPADRYGLHGLLCARFGLSLARRWPKEIHADWLNRILLVKNIEPLIGELIKSYGKGRKFSLKPKQQEVLEFEERGPNE